MPLEAVIEWGITLFVFAVLALACVQALWPTSKVQPKIENLMEDTMDLNETYGQIENLLTIETVSVEPIPTRQQRRADLQKALNELSAEVSKIAHRFRLLPELPPAHLIEWSRAVMALPNLAFLVLDTTGVDDDSDIIRVYAADWVGHKLFDVLVKPGRYQYPKGITVEQIDEAPELNEVWAFLQAALTGRYVLSYNLQFVHSRLTENAEHYGLSTITLIGNDLQEKARVYWGEYYPPKLVRLCERIGHQLPQPATAPDRVAGQLALLKAMSQGITDVAVPVGVGATEAEDYLPEENPF